MMKLTEINAPDWITANHENWFTRNIDYHFIWETFSNWHIIIIRRNWWENCGENPRQDFHKIGCPLYGRRIKMKSTHVHHNWCFLLSSKLLMFFYFIYPYLTHWVCLLRQSKIVNLIRFVFEKCQFEAKQSM